VDGEKPEGSRRITGDGRGDRDRIETPSPVPCHDTSYRDQAEDEHTPGARNPSGREI
jgi:hypothetical protein